MRWVNVPLDDLGDLVGHAVKIVTAENQYQGSLRAITESYAIMEIAEGYNLAVPLHEIIQEGTQLFKVAH